MDKNKEIDNFLKEVDLDHKEFLNLDTAIKLVILPNNGTTNSNFYLKNFKNSYVKNTGPFEGTIDVERKEFITPPQITNNCEFKLFRMPKSMIENIYKVDYKARFLSTLIYDLQSGKIFEYDGKEFKEMSLNTFINKLNNFDNDNITSAIYDTIDFSQRLGLACESLEERDFFFKNINQAFSNSGLAPFFKKNFCNTFF